MVDIYHLFKLGTTTAKFLKVSKGLYSAGTITKTVWKPLVGMGVSGVLDAAFDDAIEKIEENIKENK